MKNIKRKKYIFNKFLILIFIDDYLLVWLVSFITMYLIGLLIILI